MPSEGPLLREFIEALALLYRATNDVRQATLVKDMMTFSKSRVLKGSSSVGTESFYRLRSAGLMAGDSERNVRLRCQLYATYLEKYLL